MQARQSDNYSVLEVESVAEDLKSLDSYIRDRFHVESDLLFEFILSMTRAGKIYRRTDSQPPDFDKNLKPIERILTNLKHD